MKVKEGGTCSNQGELRLKELNLIRNYEFDVSRNFVLSTPRPVLLNQDVMGSACRVFTEIENKECIQNLGGKYAWNVSAWKRYVDVNIVLKSISARKKF
jgi:hypothetical protein